MSKKLAWTKKRPTKTGYYWYKAKIGETLIAFVDMETEWVDLMGYPGAENLDFMQGEWAGPIPLPAEPCAD